jgi:hypothetical protein
VKPGDSAPLLHWIGFGLMVAVVLALKGCI